MGARVTEPSRRYCEVRVPGGRFAELLAETMRLPPYERAVRCYELIADADTFQAALFDVRVEAATELRRAGLTWTEVGELIGVSPQRASNLVRRHGRRPAGQSPGPRVAPSPRRGPRPSRRYELADLATAGRLSELLGERRAEGWSWRKVAEWLSAEHGVTVSHETLRAWGKRAERGAGD